MKLRHATLLLIITVLLTACNFTLAADVTPPPGYVEPSPMPTLGPLYPANTPDIHNGAKIYIEKCAPCHGGTGLGDGEQGKQLPISVAAIGLPEIAQKAQPSAWYVQVTQGNLDRFMPPFASLDDQERWDVVAYALTLHTTFDQIETGKNLFDANCKEGCAEKFASLEMMSALSENDIAEMIKNGEGNFGPDLTDDESLAVAMYIRTLTFAPLPPAPVVVAQATETPVSAEAGTPSAEATPLEGTAQAEVTSEAISIVGVGNVSGSLENQTGKDLPSNLKVTLRGFEHGGDPNAGPQETGSFETTVNADGTFIFEDIQLPERQIYIAEVNVNGLSYQSDFAIVEAGMTELTMPPIVVYATTEDFSTLRIDSVQIFFDFANADTAQIFAVYSISNTSDKTVVVNMGDEQTVPFIASPKGAEGQGYEASQNSAPFAPLDKGFAMPPSDIPYGLIAFASMPKEKEIAISQPALLPVESISLYLPEGMEAEGETLTDEGIQAIQAMNFHVYSASALKKDESVDFTITGAPKDPTAVNPDITQNKTLLIGVGSFGVVLILAGVWLFMRDRNKREEEADDEEDDEFDDPESLMDAIIAVDDLHRSGKLSDEAYQARREELKNALKKKG